MTPPAHTPLSNRRVVLCVTGSIAAYKSAYIASDLVKLGARVDVVMTESAQRFVGSATFAALSHNPVVTSLWEQNSEISIDHVALGTKADCIVIAPVTANSIAKLALGITDDAVTATVLASSAPLVLAPGMDADMFGSASTQNNVATLRERRAIVVGPESGRLASGLVGEGRMSDPIDIVDAVRTAIGVRYGDFVGRRVVVTAGGTREPIDPVRVITNRSTGKMGYAVAKAARDRGAQTILITSATGIRAPWGVETIKVNTVDEMRAATLPSAASADVLVMAAAISDFRPSVFTDEKIKKRGGKGTTMELEEVEDWMPQAVGPRLVKVAFAAETGDAATKGSAKMTAKGATLTVANDVTEPGSGFGTDTNRVDIVSVNGSIEPLPLMSKYDVGNAILDRVKPHLVDIE
ncbi:MAG: bifunctional phosphopantothenoylcysteine decarboxylase/phosphopantothenate--cysteine ligase CoaBC [Chloroflexi bacterium]|nr:bifunctional phosphopantothenoylcysteine decarboxylase/phosphopantothenate--cysteine ligase CoaBC [Chloroflexota bacterium]MYK61536.1 bifunctional phosphopantothenoylcysteine decarboxylase/phosphopantothenate--cysteine ligase CoaBC [Chloroflexota bacterium]